MQRKYPSWLAAALVLAVSLLAMAEALARQSKHGRRACRPRLAPS